jgi:tetraacyldisaccharide 4'-kinase
VKRVSLSPAADRAGQSAQRRAPPLDHFPPGQAVHAVAGIGNPQRFFNTLEALHWQPMPHAFADHAEYSVQALNFTRHCRW